MVTWQEVLAYFKGYTVGGEAVVRINKKHVSIGKWRNGVFAWTPAGMELAKTVVIPRGIPVTSPASEPKRGRGRPRKVEPDAGIED